MKKISIILFSLFLVVTLTTFNQNSFDFDFQIFKIKKIEIKNLEVLDKKKIKNLFNAEFLGSNLFIIDEKKIEIIQNENRLIDYIEFKKIYPSKLQIVIHEKKPIAIINYEQKRLYLTKNGEEIKFFENLMLEKLPNIFGKQNNFLQIYSALKEVSFSISEIKSFYYFEIGRWDIILKNNKVIKLPVKNYIISLKNYLELNKQINFEKYSIFDYRIEDQLILN